MLEVRALAATDHTRWETLARGYKTFYKTPLSAEEYDKTWARLMQSQDIFGFGAHLYSAPSKNPSFCPDKNSGFQSNRSVDGQLVGIAHYMFHTSAWSTDACYLQDLFVDEAVRGQGVARALLEEVAQAARARGATRYYWLTHETNRTARLLYDKVGQYKGFIRYDYPF